MTFKPLRIILWTLIVHQSTCQDQFAACDCRTTDFDGYKCDLILNIPNGIGKIHEILVTHESNKTDEDVVFIETTFVSSSHYIPALICDKFKNLQGMSIQTGLEKIDENALKNCKKLENLNFFFNKINEISENAFAGNHNLSIVDLTGNQLSFLPAKLFTSQKSALKSLRLQGNKKLLLSPEFFTQTPSLTALSLSTYHPGWLTSLEHLEELYIGPSGVVELPKSLFATLNNLKLLFIDEKNVTTLHADTFGNLPNLKQLWMKNNRIESMDEKIFQQTGIDDVNLEGNVCADGRFKGEKKSILKGLRKCFDNYKGRRGSLEV